MTTFLANVQVILLITILKFLLVIAGNAIFRVGLTELKKTEEEVEIADSIHLRVFHIN